MNAKCERGQVLLFAVVVLGLVLMSTLFIISGATLYFQNSTYTTQAQQALNLAEAGVDKAMVALNSTGGNYPGEEEVILGPGSFSVAVTTSVNDKIIESTGFVPSKPKAKAKRTVKVKASKGAGVSFRYGVQVGDGGLQLGNNNRIIGSVYSNGNVIAGNNNSATGDIWVAGGTATTSDQTADCEGVSCTDFIFGKNILGEHRLDVAQSFRPTSSNILNKVSIKIKKVGTPADITARILRDDDGKPDKNGVLATGTLRSSLVTISYGWVDITFDTSPNLSSNTTYHLMLDTSSNNTNYWVWQADLGQSYSRGSPAYSADWRDRDPVWNSVSLDLSFKTFVGGVITKIEAGSDFVISGDVHANTIENLTIQKDAFFQTIINSTALRYFPGSADPPPKSFPISEGNISSWKQEAQSVATYTGNISSCVAILGPGKYVGNVAFDNNCNITVKSPVWVTGNFNLNNNNTLTLSSEFGDTSGLIIIDGTTDIGNSNRVQGTGSATSILMLLSTYDSRTNNLSAIRLNNTGNSTFLYADKGIIEPGNSNNFKELTAWKILLANNTVISYETGLANAFFSAGPAGSYTLVKGTYQLK